MEHSGWVSRTKQLVNDAIEAGIHFIELSEDRVDDFIDKHAKDRDAVKKDIVKEMGKWAVVSTTGAAMSFIGGPISDLISAQGVGLALNTTLLFVFDP